MRQAKNLTVEAVLGNIHKYVYKHIQTVFNLLNVHALIIYTPFLISRILNNCNFTSVEQPKCRHLVLSSWHHFSVVLHKSPSDTTSVKQLPYCLEKLILCTPIRTGSLTFLHRPFFSNLLYA